MHGIDAPDVVLALVLLGVAGYLASVALGRSPWHLPETPLEALQVGASAVVFVGLGLGALIPALGVLSAIGVVVVLGVMAQRHRRGEAILFSLARIRR